MAAPFNLVSIDLKEVQRFQVKQRDLGGPVPTMNSIVSALRFFFIQTLDRPDLARKLPVC